MDDKIERIYKEGGGKKEDRSKVNDNIGDDDGGDENAREVEER